MSILITNDDGIEENSMLVLSQALSEINKTIIVAPDSQKSASAHAISITENLKVKKFYKNDKWLGYQVSGTPADCVKIALTELLQEKPQVVVSGINRGPNTGISVFYSGTVSAAREGTIAGIPSIAISMCSFDYKNYDYAIWLVVNIVKEIISNGLDSQTTLNINVPALALEDVKGIKITKQASSKFIEKYVKKDEINRNVFYELSGELELYNECENDDEVAIKQGYASITPLKLDMTNYDELVKMNKFTKFK